MRFYNNPNPYYCGIDLHAQMLYVCIIDDQGEKKFTRKSMPNPLPSLNS